MYFNKTSEVIVRFISLFFFFFFENDALLVDFEYAIEFDIPFLFEYCSYFSSPHMWVNNNSRFCFILESRLMFANA